MESNNLAVAHGSPLQTGPRLTNLAATAVTTLARLTSPLDRMVEKPGALQASSKSFCVGKLHEKIL